MRKILLITLLTTALFSLTIEEAVQRGLENSSLIKTANSKIKISALDVDLAQSNYYPTLDANYILTARDKETTSQDKSYSVINIAANLNLFNGMSDYFDKESAKDSLEVTKLQKDATTSDLKLAIKNSYINYLNAKMEAQNQQASLDLVKEQFKTASLQLEQGIISKDVLLRVEVNMLGVEKQLLSANNEVRTSWLSLKRVLGGVLAKDEQIQEPVLDSSSEYNYASTKEKMYRSRSELKALALSKSALLNSKESVDGGYLPKANLSINHNIYEEEKLSGGAVAQPKSETVTKLTLSWNLYSGGKTSKASEQLTYNSLIIDEQLRDLKLELDYQLESAFSHFTLAKKSLVVASKAYESAKESFNTVNEKYKEGVADNTDLLDSREDLTKSISDLNSAKYSLLLANARLERVIGE